MPVHEKIIFPRFAERFHGKVDSFSEPGTGGLLEFVFQIIHIPVGIAEPLCFAKSVLAAIGVSSEGYREILGVAEGSREDKESWDNFLRYLKERGLKGVKLVISDKAAEVG